MNFKACTPILYNQDEALKHQQWSLKNISPRHKTDTTQVCDSHNDLWRRYFNPINRGHIATAQGILDMLQNSTY